MTDTPPHQQNPETCPHQDVAETPTYDELARGVESGVCIDCGTHLVRGGDGDWRKPAG